MRDLEDIAREVRNLVLALAALAVSATLVMGVIGLW